MTGRLCIALMAFCVWTSEARSQVLTPKTVLALEKTLNEGGTWRCDSPGGELLAGVALGLYLRERNVGVEIRDGDWCASASAIAVLAAPRLFKSVRGHLVFHGASRPLTTPEHVVIEGLLQRWKVPPAVVAHIMSLRPGESWEPDAPEIGPLLAARQ